MADDVFRLYEGGPELAYFFHSHNCGKRGAVRRTERTVEIPVADYWLSKRGDNFDTLAEVGAVSPYYWRDRIKHVIDPADRMATVKKSLFNVDTMGMDVLSISTIEHVGERRYGLQESETPLSAFRRLMERSNRCLITVPYGWFSNPKFGPLQDLLLNGGAFIDSHGIRVFTLSRNSDESWERNGKLQAYGRLPKPWANTVIFAEKGGLL